MLAYRIGVDLMLLGFLHVREEVQAFVERVIPLVREREREVAGDADAIASLGLGEELASALGVLGRAGATAG